MERLVEWNCKEKKSALPVAINDFGDVVSTEDICAQLAMLYDIIGDCNLDRLRELVEADRENKCLTLPVRLGDHIFVRSKGGEFPVIAEGTVVGIHIRDASSYRGVPRKEYIVVRCNGFSKHIDIDRIGKIAFFSREEALNYQKEC